MKKSDMWLPSLLHDWIFSVEIVCPKILQSLSRLGDMELQICQVLNKKESELWWLPRLENKSNCIHVLEDQVMKEISLGKGLILKIFNPKGVKTWEAKSWMLQSCQDRGTLSRKNVTVQDLSCQVLKERCKILDMCLPAQDMKVVTLTWVKCQNYSPPKVSRLGKPSLE